MRPFVAGVLVALGLTAPSLRAQSVDTARVAARVTALADAYVREYVRTFPISAELSGLSAVPHDRLDANSLPTLRAWQNKEDGWAASLASLDGAALWGRPEWVTYGFLREALESSRQLRICRQELWPVNQMSGWLSYLPSVAEAQPVGTTRAHRDALARWRFLPAYLTVEMRNAQEGVRRGYSTPRAAVDLVVQQLDGLLALPDTAWPFYDPARRDTTPVFRRAWRELIARHLRPAAAQYREFLVSHYAPEARDTLAVSAQPNGAACYRAAFRAVTSLNRPPEETYRLGQELVARYQGEIRALGRENFGTDSLPVLLAGIDTLPGAHFKNRDEMLAVVRDAVHRAREALPKWFGRLPSADIVIQPYPAFLEQSASDRYEPAPNDRSRRAVYRINLARGERQTRAEAERTAFHETYPGHHLQIALAQERPGAHPITQLVFTGAFIEGWARYAEGLAEEMGLYSSPLARMGRRAWPGHGMVADVGLHLLGWSRERTAAYTAEGHIVPPGTEMEQIVLRLAVWPGQITAYDTGALEFRALRAEAERALGPRFDLRAFHDRVLAFGAITLPMMRESLTRWIREQQAR